NGLFGSDAEIVDLDGSLWAVTVDDYSAEDHLAADDPRVLGWNLATATLSDLLAVGAVPRFMLNSFVGERGMEAAWLSAFSAGVQEALTECGAAMLGGDVGIGAQWRFTGVALGSFRAGQGPLGRRTSCTSGQVVVSGALGDGNLAAVGAPAPRFELRLRESAALASAAQASETGRAKSAGGAPVACIDTSDGLVAALEALCLCDPGLRIEVDLAAVSCAPGVEAAAQAQGVPREAFLMGSAGEYELAALVPENARAAVGRAGMRPIGAFTRGGDQSPGLYFRRGATRVAHPGLPDPRESASLDEYTGTLIALTRRLFGTSGAGHGV
ncbi:MAG: AIR synthase related protein, partial [Candidatus Eisenbacteria bacterium]